MSAQPVLVDVPSRSVDEATADLLDWLAGDKDTRADYRRIVTAIFKAAKVNHDRISANDVRAYLVDSEGALTIRPSRLGSTFHRLANLGVLVKAGHVMSDDFKSRNSSKPLPRWVFRADRIPARPDELS